MSAIEFTAQAGKTFSVQRYTVEGAAFGSPITNVTDTATPTLYRADVGNTTGIVYVVATATNLRVAGYANLDVPGFTGFSALSDPVELAIKNKTDLIGTEPVLTSPPVQDRTRIPVIYIGDDYLASNGRAFVFEVSAPAWQANASSCRFGGDGEQTSGLWNVAGTITVQGARWLLSFDMPKAITGALPEDKYLWTVEISNASGDEHTVAFSATPTIVRRKYT